MARLPVPLMLALYEMHGMLSSLRMSETGKAAWKPSRTCCGGETITSAPAGAAGHVAHKKNASAVRRTADAGMQALLWLPPPCRGCQAGPGVGRDGVACRCGGPRLD